MSGWRLISDEDAKGKCKSCNKVVKIRVVAEEKNDSVGKTPICLECGAEGIEKIEILK